MESDQGLKVLLIHPPFEIYFTHEGPVGLAYLKAVARREGQEVSVLDNNVLNLPMEEAAERAKGCDAVGISMTTPTYKNVRALCAAIREKTRAPIVLGGAHPTVDPVDCLGFADFVIIGEGERTFVELLRCLKKKPTLAKL
ncbi:MAG: cobalamin-dependent protein, partial [Candidatus Diapherotrites archaeon]|nr:cobalamin-dependent protein [Candidatus Diapherotrites archaeon]